MHQWVCAAFVGSGNDLLFLLSCIFRLRHSGEVWKLNRKSSVLKWGREELGLQNAYPLGPPYVFQYNRLQCQPREGQRRGCLGQQAWSSLQFLEELPASCHLSSVSFLPTATSSWKVLSPVLKLSTKLFLTQITYVKSGDHSVIQYYSLGQLSFYEGLWE